MPKGMPRTTSDSGGHHGRRGSIDSGGSRRKKRSVNRTMTAIGMADPEEQKSSIDTPAPAPEPEPAATAAADAADAADDQVRAGDTLSPDRLCV
eukprot:COSAG02_NODE_311_length_24966_cov_1089.426187_3_plen_94_part_00